MPEAPAAPSAFRLTDEQKAVITAETDSRSLVLAGPGTGKTEVLARRLVHLLGAGLRPSQMLVLSFSRNAVRNVSDRVRHLSGVDDVTHLELRHLVVRTFDSWSFRVLRQSGESAEDLLAGSYEGNIAKLVGKLRGNQRDEIGERLKHVRHIIVDELQDLAGWRGEMVVELLRLLCPDTKGPVGFTLLGDPAQAIYGFSLKLNGDNASVFTAQDLLASIRKTYSDEIAEECLVGNFRSKKEIANTVDKARDILLGDESAEQKLEQLTAIVHKAPEIDKESLVDSDGDASAHPKLAILCETNGQALSVGKTLYGRGDEAPSIPIELAAGSPSRSVPAWIGATLGRFSADLLTKNTFGKIYDLLYKTDADLSERLGVPPFERAWEMLALAAQSRRGQDSISIATLRERLSWPDLLPDDEGVLGSSIEITTVHQSKGLEYDRVSIVREERDEARDAGERDDGGLLEEANVLFVALSRAGESFARLAGIKSDGLRKFSFGNDQRVRWCDWWWYGKGCDVEIGLKGDVSAQSFVSKEHYASSEEAGDSQAWLSRNADSIRGRKVVLVKRMMENSNNKVIYDIHLQEDSKPARLLGSTRPQLTFDLLSVFKIYGKGKKFVLPARIFNLRIADVISMSGSGDQLTGVHEPWSKSGLWVGVRLHGLGYFKPRKRS